MDDRNWFWRIALLLALGIVLFFAWGFCCIVFALGTVHRVFCQICLTVFLLALFGCGTGWILRLRRVVRLASLAMILPVAAAGVFFGWHWWERDRFPVVEHQVKWWEYRPDGENSKLVEVTVPEQYCLEPGEGYPRLNGAYALYPVYAAMVKQMYPEHLWMRYDFLSTTGSDIIYDELLAGRRDLIFALAPSKEQEKSAKQAGLSYELTPFCRDAFVFYVNSRNPVDNLTTEQVRGIYSGRITNWREVGSPVNGKIVPFQRNEGSGSQTTLQRLMGDTPIMAPLREDRVGGMGDIINDTANYRNYSAAIGFSFRFYATELLRNDQIKLLSIDGVAPTVENIRNGTYPLVATAYLVTVRPRSPNMRKIADFMCSPCGQELVEKTGYVPILPR